MTLSTSSAVMVVVRRRFGTPALFTSTSMPPSSAAAVAANASSPSRSARSTTHIREAGASERQTSSTSTRRSSRRAQMPTVAPRCGERDRGGRADAGRSARDEDVHGYLTRTSAYACTEAVLPRHPARTGDRLPGGRVGDRPAQGARGLDDVDRDVVAGELGEERAPLLHADRVVAAPVHDAWPAPTRRRAAPRSAALMSSSWIGLYGHGSQRVVTRSPATTASRW